MGGELLVISGRSEDVEFGRALAARINVTPLRCEAAEDARKLINASTNMVVFWDVDHPLSADETSPTCAKVVGKVLMESFPPDRVFAVSSRPLREAPYLLGLPTFGHHVYRQYKDPATPLCSALARACTEDDPFGLAQYLPPDGMVTRIDLTSAGQRGSAVEAIERTLLDRGVVSRLALLATQASDGLLMNAIFDAPVDAEGKNYRKMQDRAAAFELAERERVHLELGVAADYIAISVVDRFGSLDRDSVLGFIRKNYSQQAYEVREDSAGAGLGIYGIMGSGLSLLFASRYGERTQVTLFIPTVANFREFRESFRFCSIILR